VIEVDEGVHRPERVTQFLPCNRLAWSLKQCDQNLEGLFLELHSLSVLMEFPRAQICLERAKTDDRRWVW
jgi:hypothetical protein